MIYAIFFWTAAKQAADCFNNIVSILLTKIRSKKVCEKIENNSTLEKVLRLVEVTLDSKVTFLRRMRKKNLIILKSLQNKVRHFFVLFVCRRGRVGSVLAY